MLAKLDHWKEEEKLRRTVLELFGYLYPTRFYGKSKKRKELSERPNICKTQFPS